ncbi:MAG: low molecular weight phosphotyrosine protein phosphatase [Gammaproteobacteria bacterium]|nr:low molecular weight phosphotyrosine protein phosphatase [Gammaproteobacteria bacterium]
MNKVKVLFVCMGNICRSPTAHGVFRKMVIDEDLSDLIEIDSAGTHAYHVGNPPDTRAQHTADVRGIDLSDLRARQARSEDFEMFDYVIAMDKDNYHSLKLISPKGKLDRLYMFLDFAPTIRQREVPDPYYGGPEGFEKVFDMVDAASRGLLADIRQKHL